MDSRLEWRVWSRGQRRVQYIGVTAVLLLFAWALTVDDLAAVFRIAYALMLAVLLTNIVTGRARTVADSHGVEVCGGIRTRRVPWAAVEEVRAVRSQWEDPKVEIHLTDGSTRTLPCVGTDDVPQLEELHTLARE